MSDLHSDEFNNESLHCCIRSLLPSLPCLGEEAVRLVKAGK